MKNKKFYQKYTLKTEDEVLALMYLLLKDGIGEFVDEAVSNFATERTVDTDNCDFSCSYLITNELNETLSSWVDSYDLTRDMLKDKGMSEEKVANIVKMLYSKMVGDNNLEDLLNKDREVFGSDVNFYKGDTFISELKKV
jgi:hypothetical protein